MRMAHHKNIVEQILVEMVKISKTEKLKEKQCIDKHKHRKAIIAINHALMAMRFSIPRTAYVSVRSRVAYAIFQ